MFWFSLLAGEIMSVPAAISLILSKQPFDFAQIIGVSSAGFSMGDFVVAGYHYLKTKEDFEHLKSLRKKRKLS